MMQSMPFQDEVVLMADFFSAALLMLRLCVLQVPWRSLWLTG
jgi:hypothetical protein